MSELLNFFDRGLSKSRIERNLCATPARSVVEAANVDGTGLHVLKTQSLGAQLDAVGVVFLWFAAFIFDRDNLAALMELDYVGLASDS